MHPVQSTPHENIPMTPLQPPPSRQGSLSHQGEAFGNLMQSGNPPSRPSSLQQGSSNTEPLPGRPSSYPGAVGPSSQGAHQPPAFLPSAQPHTASPEGAHSPTASSTTSQGADLYGASEGASLHPSSAFEAANPYHSGVNSAPANSASPGPRPGFGADNTGTNGITGNSHSHQVGSNSGTFFTTNNSGTHGVVSNSGVHSSLGNTGNEFVGTNTGEVNIANSSGNHVVDSNNGGHVEISNLQPNATVLVNNQNGSVHQNFPQGSMMNYLHPTGIDHSPSSKPLWLDQYGTNKFGNVPGNMARAPLQYTAKYGGVASGAAVTGAVLFNNGFSIPASLSGSVAAGKHFGGP